ncbi:hypothetical protein [Streptomyces sp. NBC_00316]|uniref:hypothetical protein n=1 Tax=Streptomyces sp. NBC_00316 TaxID=2975710 RepID=UPI002E2D2A33|nr:hypothetical protein [Streptomyces sp. NBC_00316]
MTVDADGHSGSVRCRLQRADGSTVQDGSFALSDEGYGARGAPCPAGTAPVTGVGMLTADGSVLAGARFSRYHR